MNIWHPDLQIHAAAEPLEPSDLPPPDEGAEMPAAQRRMLNMLAAILNDERETAGPFPIGGPAGNYFIRSPFDTPAEVTIVTVTFSGAATGILAWNATPSAFSGTSTYNSDPMPTYRAIPVASNAAGSIPGFDLWTPVDGMHTLYWTVSGAGAAVVVLAFRRRMNPDGTVAQL